MLPPKNNNSNLHDGDLASFAESLLEADSKKPQSASNVLSEGALPYQDPKTQLDISHIEVPDDFRTLVIEGKTTPTTYKAPKVEEKSPNPTELLVQFQDLLNQGKKLIAEMTTCGMIGTNLLPAKKVVKKKKTIQEIVNSVLKKNN